jgi:hypothetical protein
MVIERGPSQGSGVIGRGWASRRAAIGASGRGKRTPRVIEIERGVGAGGSRAGRVERMHRQTSQGKTVHITY